MNSSRYISIALIIIGVILITLAAPQPTRSQDNLEERVYALEQQLEASDAALNRSKVVFSGYMGQLLVRQCQVRAVIEAMNGSIPTPLDVCATQVHSAVDQYMIQNGVVPNRINENEDEDTSQRNG